MKFELKIIMIVTMSFLSSCGILRTTESITASYSFEFLDKKGLPCGYEFQYSIKKNITNDDNKYIETKIRKTVRKIAGGYSLFELMENRNKIELEIIEIITNDLDFKYNGVEITILNLIIPKKIKDLLIERNENIDRIK